MDVSLDDFRRHFEILSDDALLATNREDLVAGARDCYDVEVARRGLNSPPADETVSEGPSTAERPVSEELVLIATFSIPDEANLARGLLHDAEIPYHLQNEFALMGGINLRLMVPASFVDEALEILESQISDEELAAQAEAAALAEEESEEG